MLELRDRAVERVFCFTALWSCKSAFTFPDSLASVGAEACLLYAHALSLLLV
jgi:hypothetical protein